MNVLKSIEVFVSGINLKRSKLAANPVLGSKLLAGLKVSGKSKGKQFLLFLQSVGPSARVPGIA
jgi:hypothetical protein